MTAVLLSLAAAGCWGCADFLGGLQSKRLPVPVVLAMVESVGLVAVLAVIVLTGEPFPDGRTALLSMIAGSAGVLALGLFYRALAIGTMSIVAPISASGVTLPVVVGLATGDHLSLVVSAGLAVTFVGVILASRETGAERADRARGHRQSIVLALFAATGFGTYFVLADSAADESVLWLLALARFVTVPALLAIAWSRGMPGPDRGTTRVLVLTGILDVSATGLYAVATTKGALSIVSVVGSVYPVTTVVLARFVLGERIAPWQRVGVIGAFAGIATVAGGAG